MPSNKYAAYTSDLFFIPKPEIKHKKDGKKRQFPVYKDQEGAELSWCSDSELPEIGDLVRVLIKDVGLGHVVGYFSKPVNKGVDAFIGVMVLPLNPPEEYDRRILDAIADPSSPNWAKQGIDCFFGIEIRRATEAEKAGVLMDRARSKRGAR